MKKNLFISIMFFVVMFFVTACGSSNTDSTEENTDAVQEETSDVISVTDLAGNVIEFDTKPERIIPFSTGDLDIIQALGGEVVGRPTSMGEVPAELADIPEVGSTNGIDIEMVASLDPDVVIAHPQLNAQDIPALEEMGIKVVSTGAKSIEDIESSITMFGQMLQNEEEAEALISEIDTKVEDLKNGAAKDLRALIIFGVPGNWMAALPDSLSGSMFEAVGVYNIAKDYPKLEQFPQYAQLSIEKIVEANPEAVFVITPGSEDAAKMSIADEMEKNPTWKSIAAVQNENVVYLPNDLFGSNPGTKIIDSLDYLDTELQKLAE